MAKSKVATPPAAKPKFCTSRIRRVAVVEACNTKLRSHHLLGDFCTNKENHLYPIVTGFCQAGWHEGQKARTASGQPAPTCKFYINCPCDCHTQLNRMYEMAGEERVLVDNSDFKVVNPYVLPSLEPLDTVSSVTVGAVVAPVVESPAPGVVPATVARTFVPTVSGRLGKGELEAWVKEVTDIWAVEKDAVCTVGYLSRQVGLRKGINPPSQGAIQNILFRWKDLGFAHVETTRPMHFTGYTEDGISLGLENLKARARRLAAK